MEKPSILQELPQRTKRAVAQYWETRDGQRRKQEQGGKADQGLRSAVTGGAHMNGFIDIFTELIEQAGIPEQYIHRKKAVELPGFFRPTKEWDLLVVKERTLIAAIEAKSQVGPSFGNNFNNRTEEAMGSAPISKAHSHILVISSCWKIATRRIDPLASNSLISKCSRNS